MLIVMYFVQKVQYKPNGAVLFSLWHIWLVVLYDIGLKKGGEIALNRRKISKKSQLKIYVRYLCLNCCI